MNGATRFTTKGPVLGGLLPFMVKLGLHPATLMALVVVVLMSENAITSRAALAAGGVALGTGWALTIYRRYLSVAARMCRSMARMGIVRRKADGGIEGPRQVGMETIAGRNRQLRIRLPEGRTLDDVLKHQEAIEQSMQCELDCWIDRSLLYVKVWRHPLPERIEFAPFYAGDRPDGQLLIGLGMGRRGAIWTDLAQLPHLLVGGMTMQGKSVMLRQALTWLVLANSPADLELVLVDLKHGIELATFGCVPHARAGVADSPDAAHDALTDVRVALERRMTALRGAGVRDLDEWRAAGNPAMRRIAVVVDDWRSSATSPA
ncbi:MAG: FtsK/SpoIIIE domain-containing protein [Candidatus Dormibacteria bacterium]